MEKNNTVRCAGGFIIQLMPFAEEETIVRLEHNLSLINSVTALLDQGLTPEELLKRVLDGFDVEITEKMPCGFVCNCSSERVERALISIGKEELHSMIEEGEPIEVNCHFCGKTMYLMWTRCARWRKKQADRPVESREESSWGMVF